MGIQLITMQYELCFKLSSLKWAKRHYSTLLTKSMDREWCLVRSPGIQAGWKEGEKEGILSQPTTKGVRIQSETPVSSRPPGFRMQFWLNMHCGIIVTVERETQVSCNYRIYLPQTSETMLPSRHQDDTQVWTDENWHQNRVGRDTAQTEHSNRCQS